MRTLAVRKKVGVDQKTAGAQKRARARQRFDLLGETAEVMQRLQRDNGVDAAGPTQIFDQPDPVVAHEIGAAKHSGAPTTGLARDALRSAGEQVRGQVDSAILDVGEARQKYAGQVAGPAGQLNHLGGAWTVPADAVDDPLCGLAPLRPLAVETVLPAARLLQRSDLG